MLSIASLAWLTLYNAKIVENTHNTLSLSFLNVQAKTLAEEKLMFRGNLPNLENKSKLCQPEST